jgi:hypothetical protein
MDELKSAEWVGARRNELGVRLEQKILRLQVTMNNFSIVEIFQSANCGKSDVACTGKSGKG